MNLTVSYYIYYCELHNIKSGEGRQLFSTYATDERTNEHTTLGPIGLPPPDKYLIQCCFHRASEDDMLTIFRIISDFKCLIHICLLGHVQCPGVSLQF